MEEAINVANILGDVEQIYLTVTITNDPARNLYGLLGFNVYGTEQEAL